MTITTIRTLVPRSFVLAGLALVAFQCFKIRRFKTLVPVFTDFSSQTVVFFPAMQHFINAASNQSNDLLDTALESLTTVCGR